jgi:type VI secretion system protein ImpL
MNYRILIIGGLVSYYLFAWLATSMLRLTGVDLWVVRGFLAMVGLSGAGLIWWYQRRKEKRKAEAAQAQQQGQAAPMAQAGGMQSAGSSDDADLYVRDAEARLAASNVAKGAKTGNLPVIFLLGPGGSAKTHTMIHSGLEPELLAGHVYHDNTVAPTRSVNLWISRQTVFVEAGGGLLFDPGRWTRLVKKLAPKRLATTLGRGVQAPRAAVVCFDLEEFMKPGARDTVAVAVRNLHARLGEISNLLGISFPVYVLFTKADRLPFFLEYVRNLSTEEATQVVGTTLPLQLASSQGVYAEQASQRLGAAFDDLFRSFCDKRVEYLSRENAPDKLPGIYEFPRDFRKLRPFLVQFLVDLCKPSQLRAAPFLRGFYFSGVRPIVVDEIAAPVARPQQQAGFEAAGSATGIFKPGQIRAPEQPQQRVTGTRRVPQWVFLSHFWNDIVLADRDAISASSASVKTSRLRRVLLITAASLCLLYSMALTVSCVRNRSLESRVLAAAKGISTAPVTTQDGPSLEDLKRLEAMRVELATLTEYEREGAPLSLRWGLYTGHRLYPEAYRLYYARFHQLLFGGTQAAMLDSLRRLPPAPGPSDTYGPPYNTLKAYLITTSEWKRSTRAFLSPYLSNRWSEGKNVDPDRMQLAQKQFDFYSEDLHFANPFSTESEAPSVERARRYLKQFNADERIYQALLEEASKRFPSVNFNRMFPNPAVSDSHEVRGAFTNDGWKFMQAAFKKPDTLFGGEDWVLGPQSFANLDRAQLEQKLRGFYQRDYVNEWRQFLRQARVNSYQSLPDAADKLGVISSNQSPLLALFCLVSQNTNVDQPDLKNAFQAPQQVVPPACQNQYVGPSNQSYMGALLKLQNSVAQVATTGPSDAAAAQTLAQANDARFTTQQIAQTFGVDAVGRVPETTRKLMEDPITELERILKGMGPAELRAKGRVLCGQFHALMAKYPFNLKSSVQASVDDVNRFFRPQDGALWQFYAQDLQKLVQKEGSRYVAKSGGTMSVTAGFLGFFNRAAAFAEAAYPNGAQQPHIPYTLRSDLSGTNQSIALTIDGQSFSNSSGKSGSKQFVWPGNPPGVRMQVKFGGDAFNWPSYQGVWAAFEFFGDSEEKSPPVGSVYRLEWTLRTGQSGRVVTTSSGQPVSVRFDLDMMGSPPIFRKGYFSGWACTADVAR